MKFSEWQSIENLTLRSFGQKGLEYISLHKDISKQWPYFSTTLQIRFPNIKQLYPYKELRITNFLARRRFLKGMASYFEQLVELNNQMPVAQYGRIQKNTKFFIFFNHTIISARNNSFRIKTNATYKFIMSFKNT